MKFVVELCSLKCYRGESHWICPHYRSQRGSVCKLRATGAPDCQWCVADEFTLGELQLCFVENLMWTTVDSNAVKNYVWNARWIANVYNVGSSSSQLCRCLEVCKPYHQQFFTSHQQTNRFVFTGNIVSLSGFIYVCEHWSLLLLPQCARSMLTGFRFGIALIMLTEFISNWSVCLYLEDLPGLLT